MNNKGLNTSIEEIEKLLLQQKKETAEYITRNLTHYSWFNDKDFMNIDQIKKELREQVMKSPMATDYQTLKRFLK